MVSRMLQVVRVVHPDERMSGSGGLPLGVEPNQVLRQDGGIWCGLGGAMWSAPQAEQRQFRGQAIPARGGKARRGGDEVHPTGRTEPSPHQAIPATDGGASRGGEARWRRGVPAST